MQGHRMVNNPLTPLDSAVPYLPLAHALPGRSHDPTIPLLHPILQLSAAENPHALPPDR